MQLELQAQLWRPVSGHRLVVGRLALEERRVKMLSLGKTTGGRKVHWEDQGERLSFLLRALESHVRLTQTHWEGGGARCSVGLASWPCCEHTKVNPLPFQGGFLVYKMTTMVPLPRNPIYPWAGNGRVRVSGRALGPLTVPSANEDRWPAGRDPTQGPRAPPSCSSALGCLHTGAMSA